MLDIPPESIFVLVFLLISFLSWITEKVRSGRIEAPRDERPELNRPPKRPPPSTPPPVRTERRPQRPGDAMREILQSLGIPVEDDEEEEKEAHRTTPPPLPEKPKSVEAPPPLKKAKKETKTAGPGLSKAEAAALEKIKESGLAQTSKDRSGRSPGTTSVRSLLKPQNIRSALILKEILDPPKSLRDSADLHP